jgi:hypothetical protein
MSPPRRRGTYKPPRNRRELTIAVLSSVAIVVVTAVLIWVLRPNKDLGSSPAPVATTAPVTTVPVTTLVPTDTTAAPADTTPSDTTPATTP